MKPEVSVIVPAYNTETYIKRAIDSVLSQTFEDFEIIVVDDASTDGTVQVLKGIQDDRLKLVCQKQNGGAGAARNRALQAATGDWIAVLDSDDWYAPERLERLLTFAKENQADMVADDFYIIEDGETEPRTTMIKYHDPSIVDVLNINPVSFVLSDIEGRQGLELGFSKPLFRRQLLVENNITYKPEIKVSQDFWLDLDCLVRGAKFLLLPEPYYYYRSRDGALTTSTNKVERLNEECAAVRRFFKDEASYLKQNADLVDALNLKLKETRKLKDYYKVVDFLKQGKLFRAGLESLRYPLFYQMLLSEVPKSLSRHFSAIFFRTKVYKKFS
ncbi:glycosyl transferase [Leptolyngbya sp. PCC 7375]|nr:glycosyl transferase [Leptolyngbya sp. PCC 7375]